MSGTQIPSGNDKQKGRKTRSSARPVFAGKAWQQVLTRDASADGQFVYAVKSTGIYCRPSCASRKPERKNVSFFGSPALAEGAGFRACLRCEPARADARPDPQAAAIERATTFLAEHAGERTSLDALAEVAGLSRFATQRAFKRVLGVTPGEFAREQRRERFRDVVRKPKATVTEAVYEAGFGSTSRVYEPGKAVFGMKPSAMKVGGKGSLIRYTITDSPLDRMLVAATDVGVCAIAFGDHDGDLVFDLRERFPQARIEKDERSLQDLIEIVTSHLGEHPSAKALPLDVRQTAFQHKVWSAMQAIPRGETLTYGQVAKRLGIPKGAIAVGGACGANPVAVLIPCHRIVASDGSMHGWRWGVERKRTLLQKERILRSSSPAPSK